MLLYRVEPANLGGVEDIEGCQTQCIQLMGWYSATPPDRAALKALRRILINKEPLTTWAQANQAHAASSAIGALRHQAPADRALAAQAFAELLTDLDYEREAGLIIDGLVENLSTSTPANIRAAAILALTRVSDSFGHMYRTEAQTALARVAHLTTAPVPPVRKPVTSGGATVTEIPFGPSSNGSDPGKIPVSTIVGVVGALAIAGTLVFLAVKKRREYSPAYA